MRGQRQRSAIVGGGFGAAPRAQQQVAASRQELAHQAAGAGARHRASQRLVENFDRGKMLASANERRLLADQQLGARLFARDDDAAILIDPAGAAIGVQEWHGGTVP